MSAPEFSLLVMVRNQKPDILFSVYRDGAYLTKYRRRKSRAL